MLPPMPKMGVANASLRGEVRELDFGFLQPYLNSIELMIKSTKYLGPRSGTKY
ncbi:hypothetical protein ACTXT7_001294 [Hymenolepis weldensis]